MKIAEITQVENSDLSLKERLLLLANKNYNVTLSGHQLLALGLLSYKHEMGSLFSNNTHYLRFYVTVSDYFKDISFNSISENMLYGIIKCEN